MLEIDYDDPTYGECSCCGRTCTSLARYVDRDGDAFAVVNLRFWNAHERREVWAIVSVGNWTEECDAADRDAFGLILRSDPENYVVIVADAAETPWGEIEWFGRKLTRDAALEHPLIDEIFHIADHLFREDQALLKYFDAPAA